MRWVNDEGDVLTVVEIDPSIATVTFEVMLSNPILSSDGKPIARNQKKIRWSQTTSIETLCKLLDEGHYTYIEEDEG